MTASSPTLKRSLGRFSATMLVVGNMIGVGIFVTAARIYTLLPNPIYVMVVWVVGGVLSLVGGLTFAELATRFPRAGGQMLFLRESLGPFWGFLAGFSACLVTIPGTAAFLAIGFTKYLGIGDPVLAKMVGVGLILGFSLINYLGVLKGAALQNGLTVLKIGLIGGLIVAGFGSMQGSWQHFSQGFPLPYSWILAFPLALVPVMYTYNGWEASIHIAAEVKNPRKTLPFSMVVGTLLVMGVYLELAALYLYALPVSAAGNKDVIVTLVVKALMGDAAAKVITGLVAISIVGCLSTTILIGPRMIYAMAKDAHFPSLLGHVHPRFFTPGKAIAAHAIWASILVMSGTFSVLLHYVTVPNVLFAALTGIGLFVVRSKNRHDGDADPYLAFGYPYLTVVFVAVMLWIVVVTATKDPQNSLWGLGMVILGIPVYGIQRLIKQ